MSKNSNLWLGVIFVCGFVFFLLLKGYNWIIDAFEKYPHDPTAAVFMIVFLVACAVWGTIMVLNIFGKIKR